mmetsp:Transcript_55521/g.125142  ORF Transcript_55521/g.125142 Transcript_55521/m.125142 type:complete len:295 (-) Transcript_55521:133-1017(-)
MDEDVAPQPVTEEESTVPQGCRVVLLSPFEVHFSQTRIRDQFQDGHTVEETIAEITFSRGASVTEDCKAQEDVDGSKAGDVVVLSFPFPRIEVTRWRCKLREADGTPKLDPATGHELYSHEERWFTFDNRRLCCLQRAAAALWPTEARCEVIEIPATLARTRELRKFDTRTFGCSVIVGKRDDPDPYTWSWRIAVGLPEEAQPECGVARQKSLRWRGRSRASGDLARGGRRGAGGDQDEAESGHPGMEAIRSALLFLLVYLALRLAVHIFRRRMQVVGAGPAAAPPASSLGPPT